MGLLDSLRGQFVDVIEHVDDEGTTLVTKYERPGDEIKQGSQVIVREGQCAVFMKGGALADIMGPGTFTLTTENLPLLSTLAAIQARVQFARQGRPVFRQHAAVRRPMPGARAIRS